jgi:pimeloyl-ACP methyl ester carboxylesterase
MPFVDFEGSKVYFESQGQGVAVILLHGFLEHSAMWQGLVSEMSVQYQVVTFDLCGHGKSATLKGKPSVVAMAKAVSWVISNLKLDKFLLVGHSMGGYVALELLKIHKEKIGGLCLFHSTSQPDSVEKQLNRDRAIQIVKENKASFISLTIPMLFGEENRKTCQREIDTAVAQGLKTKKSGVIYCLKAMKVRSNNMVLLNEYSEKVYYVMGDQDPVLPVQFMREELKLVSKYHRIFLKGIGHMSHLERPRLAIKTLQTVIGKMALQC